MDNCVKKYMYKMVELVARSFPNSSVYFHQDIRTNTWADCGLLYGYMVSHVSHSLLVLDEILGMIFWRF